MRPTFRADAVRVQVPATSANIGPGFDTLGLALGLVDDLQARVTGSGLQIEVAGEGEALPRDEDHLVVRAMRAAFDRLGGHPGGLWLGCTNRIPHGRGLGSSAAAIAGGILLARALVVDGDRALPDPEVLALASQMEGHPDNVAPALLGGFTIAWRDGAGSRAIRVDCDPRIRPVVLIPPFEASTEQARGLLPATVPHADAAANAGRAALLVAALSGAPEQLFAATEDRLHQQYRAPAMPASADLVRALRSVGLPTVVSGAGPTVLVLAADDEQIGRAVQAAPRGWRALPLPVRAAGAAVVPAGPGAESDVAGNTPGGLDVAGNERTV